MSNADVKNILLSPAGGQAMHGILDYFRMKGFRTITIDSNRDAIGKYFSDVFIDVPSVNDYGYEEAILNIIRSENIYLFISWLDPEIIFWNKKFYNGEIPQDIVKIFAFNFRNDLMNFCDKLRLYNTLIEKNFLVPKTVHLEVYINSGNKLTYPLIVKPRLGTGSKMLFLIEDGNELKCFLNKLNKSDKYRLSDFVVQEAIIGDEYTIDFFADKCNLINIVIRKRIEHRGVSLKGEIVYNDRIECMIRKICEIFELDGLYNVQVIEKDEGIYVIDFNPRPSGTIMLSIKAGVDLLHNLIEKHEGKRITAYGKPKKLKMLRYYRELYYE